MAVKKTPFKREKFEERLMNQVNALLRCGMNDSRLTFVSITKVEMSPDYSYATLYWDTYDSQHRGDIKNAIEHAKGHIRSELAKELEVRHVPQLTFVYDNQFEEEKRITDILENEKKDK